MLSESTTTLLLVTDSNIMLLMVVFHQHHNLFFEILQLRSYFLFLVAIWCAAQSKRLTVSLLLLEKLKDEFVVALLIFGIDIFVEPHIVLKVFTNISDGGAVKDLIVKLKMDF